MTTKRGGRLVSFFFFAFTVVLIQLSWERKIAQVRWDGLSIVFAEQDRHSLSLSFFSFSFQIQNYNTFVHKYKYFYSFWISNFIIWNSNVIWSKYHRANHKIGSEWLYSLCLLFFNSWFYHHFYCFCGFDFHNPNRDHMLILKWICVYWINIGFRVYQAKSMLKIIRLYYKCIM